MRGYKARSMRSRTQHLKPPHLRWRRFPAYCPDGPSQPGAAPWSTVQARLRPCVCGGFDCCAPSRFVRRGSHTACDQHTLEVPRYTLAVCVSFFNALLCTFLHYFTAQLVSSYTATQYSPKCWLLRVVSSRKDKTQRPPARPYGFITSLPPSRCAAATGLPPWPLCDCA